MNDARRFLKSEDSALIPCKLRQFVSPVHSAKYDELINSWDGIESEWRFNFRAAKAAAYHSPYQITIDANDLMPSGAQQWDEINFYIENPPLRARRILSWHNVKKPVYGFCMWWEADLMPGVTVREGRERVSFSLFT